DQRNPPVSRGPDAIRRSEVERLRARGPEVCHRRDDRAQANLLESVSWQGGADHRSLWSASSAGSVPRQTTKPDRLPHLFRQPDFLTERLHSRIAAKQRELRSMKGPAYSRGAELNHAIQGLERAILVAQTRIDNRLRVCIRSDGGRELLGFLAASSPAV